MIFIFILLIIVSAVMAAPKDHWKAKRISEGSFGNFSTLKSRYTDTGSMALRRYWVSETTMPVEDARAYLGYNDNYLCVAVIMKDTSIYTTATADDQQLWNLGDSIEFFIKPDVISVGDYIKSKTGYWEMQVSPNNYILDLFIPDRTNYKKGIPDWDTVISYNTDALHVSEYSNGKWMVELWIPWSAFGIKKCPMSTGAWKFSVSRYNYSNGLNSLEYSSTAYLQRLDFHRYEDYHYVDFA